MGDGGIHAEQMLDNRFEVLEDNDVIITSCGDSLARGDRDPRPLFLTHTPRNENVVVFIDSGLPRNLISFKNYQRFFSHLTLEAVEHSSLADLHGNRLKIRGSIVIEFLMNEVVFREEVIVVEEVKIAGIILLGYNAMVRNRIDILASENLISINGMKVKMYTPREYEYGNISS